MGGLHDTEAGREGIEEWRSYTAGKFLRRMFPGDHFFIQSAQSLFLRMLSSELYQVIRNMKPVQAAAQAATVGA
jgi:medium-chain acyl-[acyl-carrier-protein] hydrolase